MNRQKQSNVNKFIGLDLDGVVIDHTESRIQFAKEYGFLLRREQAQAEIIKTAMPQPILQKIQHALYNDPIKSLNSALMPGIKPALKKFKTEKIPYTLISRRKNYQTGIKFLKKYDLWPRYFNKNNVFFVLEPEDKNIKARELGVTHYVDDEKEILNKLTDVPNKFLFDHLNIFRNENRYTRICSWQEFLKRFFG